MSHQETQRPGCQLLYLAKNSFSSVNPERHLHHKPVPILTVQVAVELAGAERLPGPLLVNAATAQDAEPQQAPVCLAENQALDRVLQRGLAGHPEARQREGRRQGQHLPSLRKIGHEPPGQVLGDGLPGGDDQQQTVVWPRVPESVFWRQVVQSVTVRVHTVGQGRSDLLEPVLAIPRVRAHVKEDVGGLAHDIDPPLIPLGAEVISEALQTAAVVVREIWNVLCRGKPDGFNGAVLKLQTFMAAGQMEGTVLNGAHASVTVHGWLTAPRGPAWPPCGCRTRRLGVLHSVGLRRVPLNTRFRVRLQELGWQV